MLKVFFGTDTVGVRQRAYDYIEKFEKKGVEPVRISADEWSPGAIRDAAGSTSLFGGAQLYILDTPSESKEYFEYVFENLDLLNESANIFVFVEEALLASQKKKLQKYAETLEEVTALKNERFNTFAMADALVRKDKKTLWLLLTEAHRQGISSEEIIGVLLWQFKMLRLAAKTNAAKDAGVKDFPYNKAKHALASIPAAEADRHARELISIYHDGHEGLRDITIALERWILTLT